MYKNLQQLYIDPLLNKSTRIKKRRRILQHSNVSIEMLNTEEVKENYYKTNTSFKHIVRNQRLKSEYNAPTTVPSQPIYLGRNKQYRKFRIWLLPTRENEPGLYSSFYRHTIESPMKKIK